MVGSQARFEQFACYLVYVHDSKNDKMCETDDFNKIYLKIRL